MEHFVFGAVLLVVILIIRSLTADRGVPLRTGSQQGPQRIADAVGGILSSSLDGPDPGLAPLGDRPGVSSILYELFDCLGLSQDEARQQLARLGLAPPEARPEDRQESFGLRVNTVRSDLAEALERALLVGIHVARADDDYAGVGDDRADPEEMSRRADEAEETLFGDGRRESYALLGKVCLALQDMLREPSDATHSEAVRDLLQRFDARLKALQAEMAADMSSLPDDDHLKWGDGRDRLHYYFKMGVTNSLRRSGCLESLGQLYWIRGVNYDVAEAYDLASRECRALASADLIDVDRLLVLGPADVRALVDEALPESHA